MSDYEQIIKDVRECATCLSDVAQRALFAHDELLCLHYSDRLRAAADAIERLQAQIPKRGEWISVKDRLPELREEVLVYAIGKEAAFSPIIAISELYIFKLLPFSNGTLEWRDPWDYFSKNYEVTHWMPLPDAPEVEG